MSDFGEGIEFETRYEFTLILDAVELDQSIEDAIYEAGIQDATLSYRGGKVQLTFSRSGESKEAAMLDAIRQVRDAGFEVLPVRC